MTRYTLDTSDTHKYGEILVVGEGREDYITVGPKNGDEDQPNYAMAHLIAAAPDLYEALEKIMAMDLSWGYDKAMGKSQDIARAALAKARGEA